MARLTPAKARALYQEGARPSEILEYNPVEHEEEMQDLMTGLAGLVYTTDMKSATSYEIGHRIPAFVIDVDVIRIYISPEFYKVTPRRIVFGAFTYTGEWEIFDTDKMLLSDHDVFIKELRDLMVRGKYPRSGPESIPETS